MEPVKETRTGEIRERNSAVESPHVSRTVLSGGKLSANMDATAEVSEQLSGPEDDEMSTPRDGPTSASHAEPSSVAKRPLHVDHSEASTSTSATLTMSSSDSLQPDAKRLKQKPPDISAPLPASNLPGTAVSSSESTPVIRNEQPSRRSTSTANRATPTSDGSPCPPKVPKPSRIHRRRSSFGSETLRVATPKRRKPIFPTSSSMQSDDAQLPAMPMLPQQQEQQEVGPSRSSSYDEAETTLAQTTEAPALAASSRSQSSCSWGTDEDYDMQPKTPRAPPAPPVTTTTQRQTTGGSSNTSYSDLSYASAGAGSMGDGASTNDDLARVMSPMTMMMYSGEGPPAPPSTPASVGASAMNRRVIKDLGMATPLPSSSAFVQHVYQLEQRHLAQTLIDDGSETPAPPRPAPPSQTTKAETDDQTSVTKRADSPQEAVPAPPMAAQSNDFAEWAVGDRYQMLRMLGQGSYGQVAQALDLHQGRSDAYVAIKRIQSPFDQQVDAIRLFRELYILRRMRGNECIIQLLDVVQPPSEDLEDFHDLYLVFEYVDTDLYKLIMSPQYLSTEHIQTFLYQMLCGLKYIHSANVIHRDLKPANILLNEDCSLKICDFGLARVVDESSVMASSKQDLMDLAEKKADSRLIDISDLPPTVAQSLPENMTLGRQLTKHVVTRWYRAPELILIQPYTTAVDIWSLGCIFAELLGMQSESIPDFEDRSPLFPGGKCYPLSGDADTEERLDQLSVIFGVIGTPSKSDIAELGKATEYIKSMENVKPKRLENLFPAADPAGLDLLRKMLKFNPKHRCTATEALGHDFFKGIRRPEMELSMEAPLESPQFLHSQDIEIDVLKQKTYDEVVWFRNNVDKETNDDS